nr:restriction endonuclease [uncultured Bacteroides sp.]
MNNYDFGILSPLRFEQLVRDLLSHKYGTFENFAEGKDGGIDFRYSYSKEKILIVQCKKYKNVTALISSLKKESQKLQHLKFTEYLLVVSLDLTPNNKEKIINIYNGKIPSPDRIIVNSDLNDSLGLPANHYIEFKYPELWMNSINVHQKIFHLGFLQHSEFIKEKIQESLKTFVPYKEYYRLIEHYKINNIAIVVGNPGIGKTTLSHALIAHYIYSEKYQLIDLSYRTIQEAESYLYTPSPSIFLIDDFLGKIKFEKGNDYIQLLLYFIEKVEKMKDKKLIITSREYILKKANRESCPANEISQRIFHYVIELKSFTRRIRTEILYNHLMNSGLQSDFIDNLIKNNFKAIIDHKNYSPRIIEHLTNPILLKNVQSAEYFTFFLQNLQKPNEIWKMVYNNLPNDLYKLVLLNRFVISEQISISKFEESIMVFIEKLDKFRQYSYDDFEHIIKEMEGTFFTFRTEYDELVDEEYDVIEFQNPSIIDFIDSFVWEKRNWLQMIMGNAIFYEQLFNTELLEVVENDATLFVIFRNQLINNFSTLTNAGFGFFKFDAPDEGLFECWRPERRIYYLHEAMSIIDVKKDWEFAELLKTELFRYEFDGTENISEKICFLQVAKDLIDAGLIDGEETVKHYIQGPIDDIKELVFLEYMTRVCNKQVLAMIRKNKKLVKEADHLFLIQIKHLDEMDFMDMMDFYDDYTQIKFILPLTRTTKKLKELDYDQLSNKAFKRLEQLSDEESDKEDANDIYNDIIDEEIDQMIMKIKK